MNKLSSVLPFFFISMNLLLPLPGTRVFAQAIETEPRVAAEIDRLRLAKDSGAGYYPITLSPYRLFWNSSNEREVDPVEAQNDRRIVQAAHDLGLTPMAVSPCWVLPPFAQPPLVPESPLARLLEKSEARISCVPQRNGNEYRRLSVIRDRMFARLVREFPDIGHWIVGYEPSFPFFDCEGRQLTFEALIPYIADTLKGMRTAMREAGSEALVVSHFLGRKGIPIEIAGELVQPKEILEALAEEIGQRGESSEDYFDDLITSFDPGLALDRQPDGPSLVPFQSKTSRLDFKNARRLGPDGAFPFSAANWASSAYWIDYFSTSSDDLATYDPDWNQWRTGQTSYIKPTPVSGGQAHMEMGPPQNNKIWTILGAVTHPSQDVVPDEFFGATPTRRNKWVAVSDLFTGEDPDPDTIHAGVFLRVNDRTWASEPDQTRFGSILYGGLINIGNCNNQYCGALELQSDDVNSSDNSVGKLKLVYFPLTEFPWSFASHQYRLQILEEERWDNFQWYVWWRAECIDLTDNGQLVGYSVWTSEWTLETIYGIKKPGLSGSKLAIGFGPAKDPPFEGSIHVDRAGTSYWIY